MEQLLIGISLTLLGFVVCFFGLRFWFYLLPLAAAVVGFYIGARGMQELFGEGFLSTAVSWLVGLVLAAGFALLSWFLWYTGVIIVFGALGALLFSGILHAIFDNPWGWVLVIVALLGALIFAIAAMVMHMPSYIVIVGSAFVGAAFMVAGVMTLFGIITLQELANGAGIAIVDEARFQGGSWLWLLSWLILGIVGFVVQLQNIAAALLPEERWVPARAT